MTGQLRTGLPSVKLSSGCEFPRLHSNFGG